MSSMRKKKVFVGLSGGVDSSVSAALLKKDGYDVTGVFIRVWSGDTEATRKGERGTDAEQGAWREFNFSGCTAADDRLDAMRVCAKLEIPFKELNVEKECKREVVDYMIREYRAGKAPNPDVFCNRFIKFGGFYNYALAHGADYVATGHYAQIISRGLACKYDRIYMLKSGVDDKKDQSYFLWQIKKEQLPHILFPVGGMRKPEVRRLAKRFGLITADKKDSQGLCFVGKVDMKEFLARHIKPKKGKVLLGADGRGLKRGFTQIKEKVIGTHDGAFFYTIGERIAVSPPPSLAGGTKGGWYIIAKDMRRNTLTVSQKSPAGELPLSAPEVTITDCNWLIEPVAGKTYHARLRYRQPLQKCRVANTYGRKQMPPSAYRVIFENPQTIAPGQSLVLYSGDIMLGGGIIT